MSDRIIVGIQAVREAIRAHGNKLERVLVVTTPSPPLAALARFAGDQGISVEFVERAALDRLARGAKHQGAIAFAQAIALVDLETIIRIPNPLIVALDEIEDPQNFGAIVRSAVALGASAVLWPEHHSAPLSPATVRASAGAIEHAALCRVPSLPNAIDRFADAGFSILGLDMSGTPIGQLPLARPMVLVVGAEGKGLRRGIRAKCTLVGRIPMSGSIASLNASVAVGIALHEMVRQSALYTSVEQAP